LSEDAWSSVAWACSPTLAFATALKTQMSRPRQNRPLPRKVANDHLLEHPPPPPPPPPQSIKKDHSQNESPPILDEDNSYQEFNIYVSHPISTTTADFFIDYVIGFLTLLGLILAGMCVVLVIGLLCKRYGPCASKTSKRNTPKPPAPSKKKIEEIPLIWRNRPPRLNYAPCNLSSTSCNSKL